jgi:hypothetical protein
MEIKEMVMRIPGISQQEAGTIAREVSRAMAQQAWRWPHAGNIDDLNLRITLGTERSRDALVASIVQAMAQAIDAKAHTLAGLPQTLAQTQTISH